MRSGSGSHPDAPTGGWGRPREVDFPGGIQSGAALGAFGLGLADAAHPLRSMTDGLRLVPLLPVPDNPRHRTDAGSQYSFGRDPPCL